MLSLNSHSGGRPIAIIKGGKYHNQIIYLDKDENDYDVIDNKPLDVVNDDYIKKLRKNLTGGQMRRLKNSLKYGEDPGDEDIRDIVRTIVKEGKRKSKKEFLLHDEGIIQPLPNFKKTERAYIAGPTESGKSYFVKNYLLQLRKVHPEMPIYVFSDVDEDEEIDAIPNTTRIPLTEDILYEPLKPDDFRDSICLFDDVDSIQNKKIYAQIQGFRDALLRRGRHENISTLITSHMMTNYKDTRVILNECNSLVFFPRSGAANAIKYTLKTYVGMDAEDIKKIMILPSRWVMVNKTYPIYVLYEKGVYLV